VITHAYAAELVLAVSFKYRKYVDIAGTCVINGHMMIVKSTNNGFLVWSTKSITQPGVYSQGWPVQLTENGQKNTVRLRQIDKLVARAKS